MSPLLEHEVRELAEREARGEELELELRELLDEHRRETLEAAS